MSTPGSSNTNTSGSSQTASPAPARTAPSGKWGRTRMAVLSVATCSTLLVLIVGGSWIWYRVGHTVVDNAVVKGHVHKVGARIDGQIESIEVQSGQRVVKNQVLIRLTDDHYQAAAHAAQAQLQSAQKRWEAEKLALDYQHQLLPLDVERSASLCRAREADVRADTSVRDKAEREYIRVASLVSAHVASVSDLDTASAQRDTARAQVETAEQNLAVAQSGLRMAQVQLDGLQAREAGLQVLAADIELARHQLAAAEADLAATVIRAPADGWVVDCIVEAGGSAKVGEPMMSLWLGAPWIEAWVDEKKLMRVRIGNPVDVTLTAFPDHKLVGYVEAIGVLADKELECAPVPSTLHSLFSNNAMIPIRIAVPNDELRLQPGLSALVGISRLTREPHRVAGQQLNEFALVSTPATPLPRLGTPNESQPNN